MTSLASRTPVTRSRENLLDGLPIVFPVVLRGPLGVVPAVALGLLACAVLAFVHRRHARTLRYAGWAVVGVAVVTAVIVLTGSARNYYLPSIVISSVSAAVLVVSAAVRRPVLGYVAARVDHTFGSWQRDRRVLGLLCGLTLAWGLVIGARAGMQWWLYFADRDGWLAAFRLATAPVTLGLTLATVWLLRRARPAPSSAV